jgi:hypothetical protein
MLQGDTKPVSNDAYFNRALAKFRLCWQLVAARRVGQGRTAGQSFVQAGWTEEIQNGADHPIPEGDPKNE